MVTSVASQCYRILFLLGGLHLPHLRAEGLAYCYLHCYMCLHDLVYWMYLMERSTGRRTSSQWCNGRITRMHLLKLNGGVPRMSLGSSFLRDLLYMANMLPIKAWGYVLHGCILHHCALTLVHNVPAWKCRQKPCLDESGGRVAKTGGLDYVSAGAERSAMIYQGKYHHTYEQCNHHPN